MSDIEILYWFIVVEFIDNSFLIKIKKNKIFLW